MVLVGIAIVTALVDSALRALRGIGAAGALPLTTRMVRFGAPAALVTGLLVGSPVLSGIAVAAFGIGFGLTKMISAMPRARGIVVASGAASIGAGSWSVAAPPTFGGGWLGDLADNLGGHVVFSVLVGAVAVLGLVNVGYMLRARGPPAWLEAPLVQALSGWLGNATVGLRLSLSWAFQPAAPAASSMTRSERRRAAPAAGGSSRTAHGAGGPLSSIELSPALTRTIEMALMRIRQEIAETLRVRGPATRRGKPLLADFEELVEVEPELLIDELVGMGMGREAAYTIVGNLVMFSARDTATGVNVYFVMANQVGPLLRRKLLTAGIEHERMHLTGAFAGDPAGHHRHSDDILRRLFADTTGVRLRAGLTALAASVVGGVVGFLTKDPAMAGLAAGNTIALRAVIVAASRMFSPAKPRAPPNGTGLAVAVAMRLPSVTNRITSPVSTWWANRSVGTHMGLAWVRSAFSALTLPVRTAWNNAMTGMAIAGSAVKPLWMTSKRGPSTDYEIRFYVPVIQRAVLWVIAKLLGLDAAELFNTYVSLFPHVKFQRNDGLSRISKMHRLTW
ncbi:MAG: hypothetical protein ACRD0H_17195, partial [Actinomycetes bacterium]